MIASWSFSSGPGEGLLLGAAGGIVAAECGRAGLDSNAGPVGAGVGAFDAGAAVSAVGAAVSTTLGAAGAAVSATAGAAWAAVSATAGAAGAAVSATVGAAAAVVLTTVGAVAGASWPAGGIHLKVMCPCSFNSSCSSGTHNSFLNCPMLLERLGQF